MQRHPSSNRNLAFRRTRVAAVLLILCTSLLRFLVVCSGPHCQESVEFAHADDVCCQAADAATPAHDEVRTPAGHVPAAAPCGCVDTSCAVELGPLPQRVGCPDLHVGATALLTIDWDAPVTAGHERAAPPPATGPPRADRGASLRRTTVLLL